MRNGSWIFKMRTAEVFVAGKLAGYLEEQTKGTLYRFTYVEGYNGPPVSLTMPIDDGSFTYTSFPPFFDGLLPEGIQLESLLRSRKLDRNDLFSQLLAVGRDMVGTVTVREADNYS
jgi:serine/threonine-protein kinase HipA